MRVISLFVILLTLGVGPVMAAPRAGAPPPIVEHGLAGSRWTGAAVWETGDRYQTTMLFRADGVLIYSYNGQTYDNGRWTQNDRLVFFDTNQNFALYVGRLSPDGRTYSGEAYNRTGARGTFTFRRD